MTARYDAAIVGAGPAGAWTAKKLAERGARVALVDPSHPREKPCGGGVTGRALALLGSGCSVPELPRVEIQRAVFTDGRSDKKAGVPLKSGDSSLAVASRREFDGRLLDIALAGGASLIRTRVADVRTDRSGALLTTADGQRIAADCVVGADGANSLVRRRLHGSFSRAQLSLATGVFAHGVTSTDIVIEMTTDPPGYLWSFPRRDHLAMGVCAQADAGASVQMLRATVHQWLLRQGIVAARLEPYSWPIPSLTSRDFGALTVSGERWYLVGDAAGLVDPVTREGIYFALRSGEMAAAAIAGSRAPNTYRAQVQEEIGWDLARAARYKQGFFTARFSQLLLEALSSSPGISAVMADLVAGAQDYRGLKWRLFTTGELGFLWRWLRGAL